MLFVFVKVSIHNPDDYDFKFFDSKGLDYKFDAEEFFDDKKTQLLNNPNIQLFDSSHFKSKMNSFNSHTPYDVFQYDYLDKEKNKMLRYFMFAIPYDSFNKFTVFDFSFSNTAGFAHMSNFHLKKTPQELFEDLEKMVSNYPFIEVKENKMLKKTFDFVHSAKYLEYQLIKSKDIVRRYTFIFKN